MDIPSRRAFLTASAVAAAMFIPFRRARAAGPHPTPRPGITAAKVLTKAQLSKYPKLVPLFDLVREMPEIVDGIRCNCGCATYPGNYSLLSCYEDKAMAVDCATCQGQVRLASRLHKEGKSLDEIRVAVDAKFA